MTDTATAELNTSLNTTRWSLEDLLPTPVEDSLNAALLEVEQLTTDFEQQRDRLTESIAQDEFLDLIRQLEELLMVTQRVGGYVALNFYSNTKDQAALSMRDRVDQVLTGVNNRVLFFSLWVKGLSDEAAERLMPAEGDYRRYIENLLKFKPYTLSENEEQIINLKDVNGIDAMVSLYDMITNSYSFKVVVDGEEKVLNRDQVGALYRHPSPDVRAAAYQELFRVYEEEGTVLSQIYSHRVRDWHSEAVSLRKYASPIAARNLANDIPDEAVEALLQTCRANSTVFQRYFRLKAGWLGVDKLRRYDIYAPLAKSEKVYEFGNAVELIMDSFRRFSPEVADMAMRIIDENHVDSEIRPGKRGGAFCAGVLPGITPWVHMNYTGEARDVATLAHELGHGIHDILAEDHSLFTFYPPLPLAETASVFAEMLLTDRLLAEESDPAVRRDVLATAIDNAYATVQRQSFFTMFEREAHDRVMAGGTTDDLCALYLDNLRAQFGDSVTLSDDFKWEWVVIPHFYHTPFYTYAYSFGQLLVLALYRQYQIEGESFIPRYMKLLAYGGAKEPAEVLSEAGFDITSPEFWQGGYDVLSSMIDELESL